MQKDNLRPETQTGGRRTCRVISDYQSAYPDPLVIIAGEELTVADKETEWSGWLWCTNHRGKSRWVPEDYVERKGSTCIALRDYDATELSVRVGEELFLGEEESDWIWCTNRAGQSGWVPAENLDCQPTASS
jgi:uncharacterized protein YgiM (DUF1202 family)